MVAESTQDQGRVGAMRAKRWLEATTRVQIHWDAYTAEALCEVKLPDGASKHFDLVGVIGGPPPQPLYVESKHCYSVSQQPAQYKEYLANCYLGTAAAGVEKNFQFMWVTWHPFSQGDWRHLCGPEDVSTSKGIKALNKTVGMMKSAVSASPHRGSHTFDPDLARVVAQRLWIVLLNDRQEQHLTLSDEVAADVIAKARMGGK
jgi:hypothetical protein